MKIKSQYIALIVIFFVWGVIGVLFFTPDNMGHLFSRSVDIVSSEVIVSDQPEEPRSAVESLDWQSPEDVPSNFNALIQDLEKELIATQNDPDKAFELRRRIQLLKTQQDWLIPVKENL
jgi:hypothetical protein